MKFTYTQLAGENTKFAPNAFDNQIGKEITVNGIGEPQRGVVVSAVVSDDGSSAEVTVQGEGWPFADWMPPRRTAVDLGLTEEDLA